MEILSEETMDRMMRSLNSELGSVKAKMTAIIADESRAKRALDECRAEIKKLRLYAEKAAEAGNEEDARRFLEKKAALAAKEAQLQASYDSASLNVTAMQQLHDKLVSDIGQMETRYVNMKGKLAAAKVQQKLNSSEIDKVEEKINTAYDEAMALAELRAGTNDDLDERIKQLKK
jgi:phage shock protein A